MNQTPATNETKLGILDHKDLNQQEEIFDSLIVNQAHKEGSGFLYDWAGRYRTTTTLII